MGIFNGNGPNTRNKENRMLLAGRVDINPLGPVPLDEAGWPSDRPMLNLGAALAREKIGANDVGSGFDKDNDVMDVALNLDGLTAADFTAAYGSNLTWLLWTANLAASWQGASFAAEYYALTADPESGDAWDADGYYLQAGYQVLPKRLEFGVRYSAINSTAANASAKFEKNETQFGINYYFDRHHLKLQSDLTLASDTRTTGKDDTTIRLQGQYYF
ncbi:hypothetical protein [Desulfuromonas sp. DDH964]|uniref:hypothetical protein n=1 Tax=Desulfuromonas sp. DDH964 TaxID=1823759 RepID=UPI0012FAFD15|nr:hypothetical protein [Desulfuromonas sp. DDH964]